MPDPQTPATLTSADIGRIASQLPPEPELAAMALVDLILEGDPPTADAATAGLLKRCGLPLVQADGSVVAIPTEIVIVNHPIYVEMIPTLTRAVRAGSFYTPAQLAALIQYTSGSSETAPPDALVELLGRWGKDPADPAAARTAGAAIRALSGRRGEVLFAEAHAGVHLDPLQVLLLMTQLGGLAYECDATPALAARQRDTAGSSGGTSSKCAALKEEIEKVSAGFEAGRAPGKLLWNVFDRAHHGALEEAWDKAMDVLKETLFGEWPGKLEQMMGRETAELADKFGLIVTVILYMLAFTIDISSAEGTRGHYRPKNDCPGHEQTHDFHLTASVRFDPALPGKRYDCFQLAGIPIPAAKVIPAKKKDGSPTSWRVLWLLETRELPLWVNAVAARKADLPKFDLGLHGAPLDADGQSRVCLYPRTEANPGRGAIQTLHVDVQANLYCEADLLELADFLDLAELEPGVVKILLKVATYILENTLLPTTRITLEVGRHAPDIYVAKGSSPDLTFGLMLNLPVVLDLYSCGGLAGPWKGSGGATIQANDVTDFLSEMTGQPKVGTHQAINDTIAFELDPKSTAPQTRPVTDWLDVQMTITNPPPEGEHVNGIVGHTDFTMNGASLDYLAASLLESTTKYYIKGVARDPRCPDNPEADTFDDE